MSDQQYAIDRLNEIERDFADLQAAWQVFDTPVSRRSQADEYANDARTRMRKFSTHFTSLVGMVRDVLLHSDAVRWQQYGIVIDTCDYGHSFAALRGQPKDSNGKARCPLCLATGLDTARTNADSLANMVVMSAETIEGMASDILAAAAYMTAKKEGQAAQSLKDALSKFNAFKGKVTEEKHDG